MSEKDNFKSRLRPSHSFPPHVVAEIQRAAAEGIYDIRGRGRSGPSQRSTTFYFLVLACHAIRSKVIESVVILT